MNNVAIGPLPAPPALNNVLARINPEYSDKPLLLYDVRIIYGYDSGDRDLPIAGETGGSEFVKVKGPQTRRRVTFHIKRQGEKCPIPSCTPLSEGERLLSSTLEVLTPTLTKDGNTFIYEVLGEYVFGMKSAAKPNNAYHVPPLPLINGSPTEHNIAASQFRDELR